MPLYGRKFFHLDRNESDVTTSFTVEHTHEKFQQQTLYEQVLKVYALERWTCQCTWRASLTHEQAYRSEIETRKSLPSLVPTYLHKPIFDIVHHSKTNDCLRMRFIDVLSSRCEAAGETSRRSVDSPRVGGDHSTKHNVSSVSSRQSFAIDEPVQFKKRKEATM